MELISEGYRGMSLMLHVAADRFLLPIALVVSLVGAAMIGAELFDLWRPLQQNSYQL